MTRHRRTHACAALLALGALFAAPALAQEGEGVTTSALLIPEGASNAATSVVNIGIRRGIREVEGVTFVHPVDRLGAGYNEEVQNWVDQLDPLADQVRTGDAGDAFRRADEAIQVFENNLRFVRRTQLVDAYMIAAVGRCRAGRRRECRAIFEQIIAFREGHEYDAERYGDAAREAFDDTKLRALSGGRGTLIVNTFPEGAEVYVDGRSYGPSPVVAVGLLAGFHYVTVKELGYVELIVRAEVRGAAETEATYELEENPEARSVLNLMGPITEELGMETAGPNIRSLASSLGTTQTIIGLVRPTESEQIHVHLYLYHVHTRLLQNDVEGTLSLDESGMETARQLAVGLYEGVDLSGGIEAPEDDTVVLGRQPELYEQWWFWLTVIGGAAVIGGAIGAGVALSDGDQVPGGFIRAQATLP